MPPLLEEIIREYGDNPFEALWFLFSHGLGFLTIVPTLIIYGWKGYLNYIQERYKFRTPYVMYHIQVPQMHEQSMKAVEQIFVHLYGAQDNPSREEAYWDGFVQPPFTFEIVSRGGYIDFYVRTPQYHREMLLAAFYAQYPDALLTEVEDYSKDITIDMINDDKVKAYGSELKLALGDERPIRSWPNWEHNLAGVSVDPLASILEMMSRLRPGEQWWLQIIAQPTPADPFKERAQKVIDDVVEPGGAGTSYNALDKALDIPVSVLGAVHDQIWPGEYGSDAAASKAGERQRLTDPEKEFVQEVDRKMSRWPYKTKIRWMYFSPPNLFDFPLGRRGMLGALQQFRFINWFVEGNKARLDAGTLRWRKLFPERRIKTRTRKMLWAYQSRDMSRGEHDGFVLNTEELASIFHFPQIEVRAPFVAKATSRGVEPPTSLVYEGRAGASDSVPSVRVQPYREPEGPPLPIANIVPEPAMQNPVAPSGAPAETPQPAATYSPSLRSSLPARNQAPTASLEPAPVDEPAPPPNLPFV